MLNEAIDQTVDIVVQTVEVSLTLYAQTSGHHLSYR